MAGSRLEKFGNVFTRVRDLMRSGVIKQAEKPVWFDVYAAFPPERDPQYVRPARPVRRDKHDAVPDIFYKEDEIRAKFFEVYGSGPKAFDLTNANYVSTCQRFVEKYSELESRGDVKPELLFEETGKALFTEGLMLRRKVGPAVAAKARDPLLGVKLSDLLAEHQPAAPEESPQTDNNGGSSAS